MSRATAFLTAALLAMAVGDAAAQSPPSATVVPYVGGFRLDDGELAPFGFGVDSGLLVGARVERPLGSTWTVGGSYGYAPFSIGARGIPVTIDGAAHLYYGTVAWSAWRGPAEARLSVGLGGVTLTSELDVSFTNPLLGFGGDVAVSLTDRFRIRIDLRDFVQFCSAAEEGEFAGCAEDTVLNHVEFSAGLAIDF